MPRRAAVVTGVLALLLLSGLTAALPFAYAQSPQVVQVSIPVGAGNPSGAPGYAPDKVTVVIGVNNTVKWTNNDTTVHHTVTSVSGNGSLNSGDMGPGATYTYTFTTPGTYDYTCVYHAWMTGTVVVLASTSSSTHTTAEFPSAWLAAVLFAVIAAVVLASSRLRPTISARPASGSTTGT